MSEELSLGQIGQIAITVTDLATSKYFYGTVLGLWQLFDTGNMTFFDCGGVRLMITEQEEEDEDFFPENTGFAIYFKVDDIQAAVATLESRGVDFEQQPHLIAKMPDHELWMAFLRDPDGYLIGLMSEVS